MLETIQIDDVEELKRKIKQLQARIDELMLEYCPSEMTEEQIEEYRRNVKVLEK